MAKESSDSLDSPTNKVPHSEQTTADAARSSPPIFSNVPGLRFGDYELLGEIARGGMGVVYRARQRSLNRVIALKMIRGGSLANSAEVKRFQAEAEAAASLQHPNIVAIHEMGEHDGQQYFSMDLVDGPTLADLVKDGPLRAGQAAEYLRTIADAVQFAHDRGSPRATPSQTPRVSADT